MKIYRALFTWTLNRNRARKAIIEQIDAPPLASLADLTGKQGHILNISRSMQTLIPPYVEYGTSEVTCDNISVCKT